ncbi:bifunctional DNA primase/polymerase [Streptomyces sp. NPDC051130]|uniref:bifunctional DNA primase/polymerase n=1 Tax=Streptomyces sp. NPDC051130 TaxID=3157223 RepID=UPI00341C4B63
MTMQTVCEHCDGPLAVMARAHAKTCSPRCRKAVSRAKARNPLPEELRTRDRWVRRAADKRPLTVAGMAASSTDPRTWSTHKDAADSSAGAGLGFVLSDEDDIVCLDLDHCLNPLTGQLAPWAASILRDAGTTYVEVSPSGDGLHIWGRAPVRQGRRIRRPDGTAVEIYGCGRYIAMTGRRHGNAPSVLADLSAVVSKVAPGCQTREA